MNFRLQLALIALVVSLNMGCVSLDLLDTETLGSRVLSVDWCGCDFLAAGGRDAGGTNGIIQVYSLDQTTATLETVGTVTQLGIRVNAVDWCDSCSFLAAGGTDGSDGLIQIYSFDPLTPGDLERVGTTTLIGSDVTSLDWCPGCSFLAVGGNSGPAGFIQIYSFDPTNPDDLVRVGTTNVLASFFYSLKWCGDCQYLAAVRDNNLSIYSFNPAIPGNLELEFSEALDAFVTSVDWCDNCNYLAIGGQGTTDFIGFINVYSFDPLVTPTLSLVASATIADDAGVNGLSWCTCGTLAASGFIGSDGFMQIYNFDQATTLSLQQTVLVVGGRDLPSVDWCDTCEFLAVGGQDGQNIGTVQLFGPRQPTPVPSPTNLRAQKVCHRFPTQIDIINTICWAAVTDAVSYKVYADESLATLLATITSAPFCFTQHQICRGKTVTYFVTAVDAEGNESVPASITI